LRFCTGEDDVSVPLCITTKQIFSLCGWAGVQKTTVWQTTCGRWQDLGWRSQWRVLRSSRSQRSR